MNKRDIVPYNNKKQPHGLWIRYHSRGNLWFKGQFINNIRYGYWYDNWSSIQSKVTFNIK